MVVDQDDELSHLTCHCPEGYYFRPYSTVDEATPTMNNMGQLLGRCVIVPPCGTNNVFYEFDRYCDTNRTDSDCD